MNQRWLLLIAAIAIAAIVGFGAFSAGVQHGLMQSGKIVAPAGPYPYPYRYYWHPWEFFFPFFGILLFFLILRVLFWRGRGWHRYSYGCGPYPPEQRENDPDRR